MGKTLDTVMHYAHEDVAKIKKHWVIFIKKTKSLIIRIIVVLLLHHWLKDKLEALADKINQLKPTIPFEIKEYIFPAIILYLLIKVVVGYIKTITEYNTVGLSINNIQLKGQSGLLDVGIVNIPLEKIQNIQVHTPFWGRVFHYGAIIISTTTPTGDIMMGDMTNVEQFQDAIVLLQEAQKEGRNIRQAERQEKAIAAHAAAQVKALEAQTTAQVQMLSNISQSINRGLEQTEHIPIESNETILPETTTEQSL